jgi:hypothetical protein
MGKSTTITHFFKRKNMNDSKANVSNATLPTTNADIPIPIPENIDIPIPENPYFYTLKGKLLSRLILIQS